MERLHRDEEGTVLVTVLIFVTVMGLVIGALVGLAGVNFRHSALTRDQREIVYTADAAVKSAINTYRVEDRCPTNGELPSVNGIPAAGRQVTCDITPSGGPSSTGSNQPKLAVITLPSPGEVGFSATSGAVTNIIGGLSSKNNIDVTSGATVTVSSGPVRARTGCTGGGTITSSDIDCNLATPFADGDDPNYAPAVSAAPGVVDVPACPPTGPVTMPAGTYVDGAALNALFSGPCATRVFHFPPGPANTVGVYHFDFANSGSHEWRLVDKDTTVVGGTLPAGETLATVASLPVGQRCNDQAAGVQFIFGGDSRVYVQDGSMELCAQHDPTFTNQEIAVYGVTSASPDPGAPTNLPTVIPGSATSSDWDAANVGEGRVVDAQYATASVVSTPAATKTITLEGFDVSGVPAGSIVNGVELEWVHRSTKTAGPGPSMGNLRLSAVLSGGATGPTYSCTTASGCFGASSTPDTVTKDVSAQFKTRDDLQSLSLTYSASATKQGSNDTGFITELDGVKLRVTYTVPAFHRPSGCVEAVPYNPTSAGSCALIKTRGNQSNLSVHGTVYAPSSPVDIELTNVAYQVFQRGIVVRTLRAVVTSSSACTPPDCSPFRLATPTVVPGSDLVVFEATVEGNKRLRALVEFPVSGTPVVRSWSTLNET